MWLLRESSPSPTEDQWDFNFNLAFWLDVYYFLIWLKHRQSDGCGKNPCEHPYFVKTHQKKFGWDKFKENGEINEDLNKTMLIDEIKQEFTFYR